MAGFGRVVAWGLGGVLVLGSAGAALHDPRGPGTAVGVEAARGTSPRGAARLVVPRALRGQRVARARVTRIVDGDTITTTRGRVRLVQIDTPEIGGGECYSRASRRVLARLAPVGSVVLLVGDRRLDDRDRYGRLLRYVVLPGARVAQVELVRAGAAAPWFYGGDRGRLAPALMTWARRALARRIGLWGACRGTRLDPTGPLETHVAPSPPPAGGGRCAPGYAGACVPRYPPDVDCGDLRRPVQVLDPADPHRLDGDGNGRGCEAYG